MHRLLWLTMLVGCYRPNELSNCTIVCTSDQECPSGFTCSGRQCLSNDLTRPCSDDAGLPDAEPDAPFDAPAEAGTQVCKGTGADIFATCVPSSLPPRVFSATTKIDTDDINQCTLIQQQMGGPSVCVVAAGDLTIQSGVTVRAEGARPLALFAINTLTVRGVVDVSSKRGIGNGAGANTGICIGAQTAANNAGGQNTGAGGGAGGSFGAIGGNGGSGDGGFQGGTAITNLFVPGRVRSGCVGTRGGNAGAAGGAPGDSGGAVYLMATTISLATTAQINASGSAGYGGTKRSGGGGGGSGGFVGFQTGTLNVAPGAQVWAFGGGGGAGGGITDPGQPGSEASTPAGAPQTPGVSGSGFGGAGGPTLDDANGEAGGPGTSNAGGGGAGGGGAGFIGVEGGAGPPLAGCQPAARPL